MTVIVSTLDDAGLNSQMTSFAVGLLNNPNRFTKDLNIHVAGTTITTQEDYDAAISHPNDKNDATIPGISDTFILGHDLNESEMIDVNGEDLGLQTNAYGVLYKIALPPFPLVKSVIEYLESEIGKTFEQIRGEFLYPPQGYMGWHTNADAPGTRIYLTYSPVADVSYFKYVDRTDPGNPQVVTSLDRQGWTIRQFHVSENPSNFLWHCVDANGAPRISYGMRFI